MTKRVRKKIQYHVSFLVTNEVADLQPGKDVEAGGTPSVGKHIEGRYKQRESSVWDGKYN